MNDRNTNLNANNSDRTEESAIENNGLPLRENPENVENQHQAVEQTTDSTPTIRVPEINVESKASPVIENNQIDDQNDSVKSYDFPSFSNLIPRSNEPVQIDQDSVSPKENNQAASQNFNQSGSVRLPHPPSVENDFEQAATDNQSTFNNIPDQSQPQLKQPNVNELPVEGKLELPIEKNSQAEQIQSEQPDQQLKDSTLNQTIRSDATWPHDDTNDLQEEAQIVPPSILGNPNLIPDTPKNNLPDENLATSNLQQINANFDPSSVTAPIDQGKLPLSDPLIPENLAQPNRWRLYTLIGLIIISLVGGAYYLLNNFVFLESDGTTRIIKADQSPMKIPPESTDNNSDPIESSAIWDNITDGENIDPQVKFSSPNQSFFPNLPNLQSTRKQSDSIQPSPTTQVRTVVVRPDGEIIEEIIEPENNVVPPETIESPAVVSPTNPEPTEPEIRVTLPTTDNLDSEQSVEDTAPIDDNTNNTEQEVRDKNEVSESENVITIPAPKLKPPFEPSAIVNATEPNLPKETIEPESVPAKNQLPQVATIPPNTPVVQLMAKLSLDSAQQGFVTLKKRHPKVFAHLNAVIQEAFVNGQTWFRVQIKMTSLSAAVNFCNTLRDQQIECFVPGNRS